MICNNSQHHPAVIDNSRLARWSACPMTSGLLTHRQYKPSVCFSLGLNDFVSGAHDLNEPTKERGISIIRISQYPSQANMKQFSEASTPLLGSQQSV